MNETLLLARLTLMVLRASVEQPSLLPARYGVILLPNTSVLTQQEAVESLAALQGPYCFTAEIQGGNLVVHHQALSSEQVQELEETAASFAGVVDELSHRIGSSGAVLVQGYGDSIAVPIELIKRWRGLLYCDDCAIFVSKPYAQAPNQIVVEFGLGNQD